MKIAVALSGGVDSAAAAWQLKQAGHDVFAITMRLCPEYPGSTCAAAACACSHAAQVARQLGIHHELLDFREEFNHRVIEPFARGYLEGETPNPCAWCNREIKFGLLRQAAQQMGAEGLATGHYVRMDPESNPGQPQRGQDPHKDQSYFLALVPKSQFAGVWFPLGAAYKKDIQAQMHTVAETAVQAKSSSEICFLHDGDYPEFIRRLHPEAFIPGEIVDQSGRVLGEHRGLLCYTIGQRRGLGVAAPHPLYVMRLEVRANRVVVGPEASLWTRSAHLRGMNWFADETDGPVLAQIRYRQKPVPACLKRQDGAGASLVFEQPVRAVTPGQIAALYHGERLLAGAEIAASGGQEA